jgi:hypothetical protein
MILYRFHWKYINRGRFLRNKGPMGQTTRSQGISFTHEMWAQIEQRCEDLRCGRSKYFQMLVEADLRARPEIHAHKSDGKWHFFPEPARPVELRFRAADDPPPHPLASADPAVRRRKPR